MFLRFPHLTNKIYSTKVLCAFFSSLMCTICTVHVMLLHLINPAVKFECHTLRSLPLCIMFYSAPFFNFISSKLFVHKRYLNLPFSFLCWKTNLHVHEAQRSQLYVYMSLVCWIYQTDGTTKSHTTESRHPLKALRCAFICEYTIKSSIFAHTIACWVTASCTISFFTFIGETRCLPPHGFRHSDIKQ